MKISIDKTLSRYCRLLLAAACLSLACLPARVQAQSAFWMWGDNEYGQLGNGTTNGSLTPLHAEGPTNFSGIAGGGYHNLALNADGTVLAWGTGTSGQLGDGRGLDSLVPVSVSGLTHVASVAGGEYHSLALKSDGTVWAWGDNAVGELGNGTTTDALAPVAVSGLTHIISLSTGGEHTLALKSDGTVWAWGDNEWGQIGDNTLTDAHTPLHIGGLTNVVAIAGGGGHSLALKSDGTVWAWGDNEWGQLGDGTLIDAHTPIQVNGLTHVIAITGGRYHSLALKADGTIWGWGLNADGELGDGTGIDSLTPIQVSGLTNVAAISAGGYYSMALKSDGTVWAWGDNTYGELGDGTTDYSLAPVQSLGLAGCTAIATGNQTSMALTSLALTLSTGSVMGGEAVTATVHLPAPAPSGGAIVQLASDDSAATLPSTVTVQEGSLSASFPVATNPSVANIAVHLTATYNSIQATALLHISAATVSPALTLTVAPSSVKGGTGVTGNLTLRQATSSSLTFNLTSADTTVATVPASVTVPAHATSVTFPITTLAVQNNTSVSIASHFGTTTPLAASLTVLAPALADFSLTPATVPDGVSSAGTITLDSVAPSGGYAVHVSSSDFMVARSQPIVTVPAGSRSAVFTIVTRAVPVTTTVEISARARGVTKTATLTLQPLLKSLTLASASVKGGLPTQGTITLNAAAPVGGATIMLNSSNSVAATPTSVRVQEGATSATFTISTRSVKTAHNVILAATSGKVVCRETLHLTP